MTEDAEDDAAEAGLAAWVVAAREVDAAVEAAVDAEVDAAVDAEVDAAVDATAAPLPDAPNARRAVRAVPKFVFAAGPLAWRRGAAVFWPAWVAACD